MDDTGAPATDQPELDQVRGTRADRYRHRPALCHWPARLFLRTPRVNVLWDCLPLLDEAVVLAIKALGGISAIAISHPHYYSSMVEWSRAFGGIPIYLHVADRQWVMRPDEAVVLWEGETHALGSGLTLVRCGGHFDGGTVLHWAGEGSGSGVLLTGDIIQVVPARKHVSFMYSYPNYIPLSASALERIIRAVEPFDFDRVHGAFWDMVIERDGKAAIMRSAERYLRAIRGQPWQQSGSSEKLNDGSEG